MNDETSHLFVDEAGDPVLFANRRTTIVGKDGCSRFFLLGKLEVEHPADLTAKLQKLRADLQAHPYFAGVESFKPERKKTALLFHAKDDLAEVRFQVFDLLMREGKHLRSHAVVCDKELILREVQRRNTEDAEYHYNINELYDRLMRSIFGKLHLIADNYRVCVARRGKSDRNEAIRTAIQKAEGDFTSRYGFGRGGDDAWEIVISAPEVDAPLQAADYFLWALQRFYEPRVDARTGETLRDERFLRMLTPQIDEIHDLHFGPPQGIFWTPNKPLTAEERFADPKKKKKKS